MGLLSKPVIDALRRGVRKWAHLSNTSESDALADNVIAGNEQLALLLKGQHPAPETQLILPPNSRYWEWAGSATPRGMSPRPSSSGRFDQVDVHLGGIDDEVVYHSHPVHTKSDLGKLGSSLSSADMDIAVDQGTGITSLDSMGGLGVMLPNRNAVREIKNRGSYLPIGRVVEDVESRLKRQFTPPRVKLSTWLAATGKPNPLAANLDQQHHLWSPSADEAASDAVGTTLERLGVADHFSYTPKNATDVAERAAHLAPMMQFAEDEAEQMLVQRLKEMGFSNGRISAIIASAGSAGAIGSLLALLQREEAMTGSKA
jgi:hypothetical protein